jgi:DNA-binding NarL/FixJ family response regulator
MSTTSNRIRVLLVDDNDDFLDAVNAWLADEPRLDVVGAAHTGRQAIDEVERLHPDLVLMDVTMSEMDGFGATRQIKSKPESPRVVLMTFHASAAARHEAWAAGADEFISKAEVTDRLTGLIRDLLSERKEQAAAGGSRPTKVHKDSRTYTKSANQGPPRDRE